MSTRGVRGSGVVRGYRRRKNILDIDLNRTPPSDNQVQGGASSQLGASDAPTIQVGLLQTIQQGQAVPPTMIDVEAIDDDIVESSPRAFAEAKRNSRRNRGRTVVDVDLEEHSAATHNNKRRRISPNQTIINCDLYINLEGSGNSQRENVQEPPPPPKEPTFSCPICMAQLVEEMSTKCGHIFCKACIKAAISVQSKCPTCRKRVTVKELIRVFLPSAS